MLQRATSLNSLNAATGIITKAASNTEKMANKFKHTKPDVEEQPLKQTQITGEKSGVFYYTVKKKKNEKTKNKDHRVSPRQTFKKFQVEIKQNTQNELIRKAIYQLFNIHASDIFFNENFKNQDFDKAFGDELNNIFSSVFEGTDLEDDSQKWTNFFKSKLKKIQVISSDIEYNDQDKKRINEENNQNFAHNLKILILAKRLSKVAKESNKNRFYYFDQNAAQKTFEKIANELDTNNFESLFKTFIETYKTNYKKELLQGCEKIDIENEQGQVVGSAYNIEQLNGDEEHDNLQIRRLQYLAAPTWCTCHAINCAGYLDEANSFLFIPNNGNRILRIQGKINENNIQINSVTNIENDPNNAGDCWISKDEDLNHLWAFISTMENHGYNIQATTNIFNMDKIEPLEKINRFPSPVGLLNKIDNASDINEIIQILNNSPYITIQNGSLEINGCNQNEKNKLMVALHDKNFFTLLNPERISTIPHLLRFSTQESINLNSITNYSRTITLINVHNFNCLNLKELNGSIQQFNTSNTPIVFNAPNLTNAKSIWLSNIENINLPNLKECDRLTFGKENPETWKAPTLPDITLEKLEGVKEFSVLNPQKLDLPSIKYISNFRIESNNGLKNFAFNAQKLKRIDTLEIRLSSCGNITQIVKKLSLIIERAANLTLNIDGHYYSREEIDAILKEA